MTITTTKRGILVDAMVFASDGLFLGMGTSNTKNGAIAKAIRAAEGHYRVKLAIIGCEIAAMKRDPKWTPSHQTLARRTIRNLGRLSA